MDGRNPSCVNDDMVQKTMFTKDDLIELKTKFPFDEEAEKLPYDWLHSYMTQLVEYYSQGFDNPGCEAFIKIVRADKWDESYKSYRKYVNEALLFGVEAEYPAYFDKVADFYEYLLTAEFKVITCEDWENLVQNWCYGLKSPPELPLNPTHLFKQAIVLFGGADKELYISAVAEYENEWVYFHWSSTV